MQPYLFPYIGYFQLISAVDAFVIYDDVQFIKKGWINRNKFLMWRQAHLFTFGVKNASSFKNINERFFADNHQHQIMTFSKFLKSNYSSAPYFEPVYELIQKILSFNDLNVGSKIGFSLVILCEYLQIKTQLLVSSQLSNATNLKGQRRVIQLCKELGAKEYINAIGGVDLYDKEEFLREGILLSFIKSKPVEYNQFGTSFVPNLSIIDVMMFNSVSQIQEYLNKYELV